jgi:hypothetical protein
MDIFQFWLKSSNVKERRRQNCYALIMFPNLFYVSIELVAISTTSYIRRRKWCYCQEQSAVSGPGLTNLRHACPKWHAETFYFRAAFTAFPIFILLLPDHHLRALIYIYIYTHTHTPIYTHTCLTA